MSYTKGKWEISEWQGLYEIGTNDESICKLWALEEEAHNKLEFENAEANARRICQCVNRWDDLQALNKQLLEACKRYVAWFDKIARYQNQRLGHGLKAACQNWGETSDVELFDCSEMRALVEAAEKNELGGK